MLQLKSADDDFLFFGLPIAATTDVARCVNHFGINVYAEAVRF
jgi:hypothetical protein